MEGGGVRGGLSPLEWRRSRNEAGTTEPGRGEGEREVAGSKKLKIHKTEESETVPKKVEIDQNLFGPKRCALQNAPWNRVIQTCLHAL